MLAARHVRRLRLGARHEAALARGRILVEDALRTASLPDTDGGRIYVVRRLDLGAIDANRPSVVVAQAIERRFAALRGAAVRATDARAGEADALTFDDGLQAVTLLVRRIAGGPPPIEWFWPLAVRGFSPGLGSSAGLRAALAAALVMPGRGAAVAALCAALDEDEVDALCGALGPRDGDALLVGLPPIPTTPSSLRPVLTGAWRSVLRRWSIRWGADDRRTTWLAATALCAEKPGRAADPALLARAAAEIAAVADDARDNDTVDDDLAVRAAEGDGDLARHASVARDAGDWVVPAATADDGARGDGVRAQANPAARGLASFDVADDIVSHATEHARGSNESIADREHGAHDRPRGDDERVDARSEARSADGAASARARTPSADALDSDAARPARHARRRAPWEGTPLPTAAGGLLFLVRPLARLGFSDWLAAVPDAAERGFAACLLCHLARRAGVPEDDIALAIWAAAATPDAPFARELLDGWSLRLARWARRRVRLSLRAIVRRPARVIATRTHVDVLLDARHTDLRVRTAGIDADPGWVAWLGRVIQFHYLDGDQE